MFLKYVFVRSTQGFQSNRVLGTHSECNIVLYCRLADNVLSKKIQGLRLEDCLAGQKQNYLLPLTTALSELQRGHLLQLFYLNVCNYNNGAVYVPTRIILGAALSNSKPWSKERKGDNGRAVINV